MPITPLLSCKMITSVAGSGAPWALPNAARMSTMGMITPRETATLCSTSPSEEKRSSSFSGRNSRTQR